MDELTIELDHFPMNPGLLGVLRAELENGGIDRGRFTVGGITAAPEMAYILWHIAGEAPVSMMFRRDSFGAEEGIRAAARSFLIKWKRRTG